MRFAKGKFVLATSALFVLTACSEQVPISCNDTPAAALVRRAFLAENRPNWQKLGSGGPVDYAAGDGNTPAALAHAFANVQPQQVQVSEQKAVAEGQGLSGKTSGRYRVCGATVTVRALGVKEDVKVLIYVAADEKLRAELQDVN